MAITALVCPRCGILSSKRKFIGMFCINCYSKDAIERISFPSFIEVSQCKRCGRVRIKKWAERFEALREEIPQLFKKLRTVVLEVTPKECEIEFVFDDVKLQKRIPVRIRRTFCEDCTRAVRGYFEATIQLRGDREKVDRTAAKIIKELQKKTFITSVNELKVGIDIKVGSTEAARAVLAGKRYLATREFYGQKAGKRLFRTTFLIRV